MLEWKSRLVILMAVAAVVATAFGNLATLHNYGW
jgi:hypothetical protein